MLALIQFLLLLVSCTLPPQRLQAKITETIQVKCGPFPQLGPDDSLTLTIPRNATEWDVEAAMREQWHFEIYFTYSFGQNYRTGEIENDARKFMCSGANITISCLMPKGMHRTCTIASQI